MTDAAPAAKLTKWIAASPQRVFEAWTTADQLTRWLSPGPDIPLAEAVADAHVGGTLRLVYLTPDAPHPEVVLGRYLEVSPFRRLVFTWAWQAPHSTFPVEHLGRDSTVTVDLLPIDGGTQVTLVHEGLPPGPMSARHAQGWTGALEQLSTFYVVA
ncbi:MAG: SRPBCC domain-containing protein [Planctomycetota bacterium]